MFNGYYSGDPTIGQFYNTGSSFRVSGVFRPPSIMQAISVANTRNDGIVLPQSAQQTVTSIVKDMSELGLSSFERSVNVNKLFQHVDYQQNPSIVGQTQTQVKSYPLDTLIPNPLP